MKIAIIISEARYDIQSSAIRGILDVASEENSDVFIFTCNSSLGYLHSVNSTDTNDFVLLDYSDYDGIILYADTISDREMVSDLVKEILESGVPSLSVKDHIEGMLYAGIDNSSGIKAIVRHMVEDLGRKRIFFLGGPEYNDDSNERFAAYKETLSAYDIYPESGWILHGDYHPYSGRVAFREWYKQRDNLPLPDAIVCANDEMASGICKEAKKHGLRIPEDIAVSGFDNRLLSRLLSPAITTVTLPGYEIGKLCAKKLFNRILNRPDDTSDHISTKPIFRTSTDADIENTDYMEAIDEIRRSYINGQTQTSNLLDGFRDMESDFADAMAWKDFYKIIETYIGIFETESFYIFTPVREIKPDDRYVLNLLSGKEQSTLKPGSEMSVPIAWENGELKKYPNFTIDAFIPADILAKNPNSFYVIYPLLHNGQMFGYCLAINSHLSYSSEWFALFIQIITSAMENLRNRSHLAHMVETLNHLWIYDKLTGVLNRAGFTERSDLILHKSRHSDGNIFVLFADLDRLKNVNDTFGHESGDLFIIECANILKQVFYKDQLIVRYGGDEFIVISAETSEEDAKGYINKIESLTDNLNQKGIYPFPVSISMGYVRKPAKTDKELEDLIEEADKLMYQIKLKKKKLRQD